MELQEIEVTIERDGEVRIEVRGVKGRRCLDLTEDVLEALGGEVAEQELTSEAYEDEPDVAQTQRIRS
jgi:hypothetical protein